MRFEEKDGALLAYHQGEMLRIESWGEDSLRVRATKLGGFTNEDWALTEPVPGKCCGEDRGDGSPVKQRCCRKAAYGSNH